MSRSKTVKLDSKGRPHCPECKAADGTWQLIEDVEEYRSATIRRGQDPNEDEPKQAIIVDAADPGRFGHYDGDGSSYRVECGTCYSQFPVPEDWVVWFG